MKITYIDNMKTVNPSNNIKDCMPVVITDNRITCNMPIHEPRLISWKKQSDDKDEVEQQREINSSRSNHLD